MYVVQVFLNRRYETVVGPRSLSGAFDGYAAQVRNAAPLNTMVRLGRFIKTDKGIQFVTLRQGKALALPIAAYFVPSTEVKNNPLPTAIKRLVPHAPKPVKKSAKFTDKCRNHTARKAG